MFVTQIAERVLIFKLYEILKLLRRGVTDHLKKNMKYEEAAVILSTCIKPESTKQLI